MKTTQGRIHVQTTRDQRSWPIKMLSLDKICIMAYQTIMINKDGFFGNICPMMVNPELFLKSKMAETCLSLPAESKIAEKCLSPPMRVANKLTPEPKSKMAKTCLSLPAESKIAEKMLKPADEGS